MTVEENAPEKKKPLLVRILRKLLSWAIYIIIFLVIIYFIIGYLEKRQEEFIETSISSAITKCNDNKVCVENVKTNGRTCVKKNYHQERVSKRVKKSILEEEGFYSCLDSFK